MNRVKRKTAWDDRIFRIIINVILILLVILVLYPIYFILVASVSDPTYVNSGALLLYPKGFTMLGYTRVFRDMEIWIGYGNTLIYTIGGTALGTMAIVMAGYALAQKDLPFRGTLMKLAVFTMYFGGGMIPFYLVVKNMGLVNTRAAMIILGSVSAYNLIVTRSFMASNIPEELKDAATIDGCGNGTFFFKIVLPLSKAIIAVMVLYIAVAHWNEYFNAMILLTDKNKNPLQLYLREILLIMSSSGNDVVVSDQEAMIQMQIMSQVIRYCVIVVSTLPIVCVYPFIQKYFVQGVMIGSVKG